MGQTTTVVYQATSNKLGEGSVMITTSASKAGKFDNNLSADLSDTTFETLAAAATTTPIATNLASGLIVGDSAIRQLERPNRSHESAL